MRFIATKAKVLNRGTPPDAWLSELIQWGKFADEEIFAPNPNPSDIYALIAPVLGPFRGLPDGKDYRPLRRAAMCETMRVHAGFESSWNWNEGVDTTNQSSLSHIEGEETGAWQVSFDSTRLGKSAMLSFAKANGIDDAESFIKKMKHDHALACEYYARLVRVSIAWAGPLKSGKILKWLSREAVAEFGELLEST